MSYLIYTTEQAAWDRSAAEASSRGMGATTQFVSAPRKTKAGKWALPVEGYTLTEAEESKVVESVEWPEPEGDV